METGSEISLDVAIVGGGVAGLWVLDELARNGYAAVLIEHRALGMGQTVASQGIIHGGLKYMFDGHLTPPARAISEMPVIWREALAGQRQPDLSGTAIRSDCCYIWGTGSIKSRIFIKGSAIALRAAPTPVDRADAPAALAAVPGSILRVPEQVIDPASLASVFLGRNPGRIVHADAISLERPDEGLPRVRISSGARSATLRPRQLILTAGAGNAQLREQLGLPGQAMQRRPLHMAMIRGDLPELFGHCVGGPKPRITVTSAWDSAGRVTWQLGGQLAEDGVAMTPEQLRQHARNELSVCLPGLDLAEIEFACYRVDRAEAATTGGQRPDDVQLIRDGNVFTAWPTKLAFAPRLAERVLEMLPAPAAKPDLPQLNFPAPPVAPAPWEIANWEPLS